MTNPSGDPEALQFDVYGGAGTAVKMSNQNTLTGTIYAPASDFVSTGVGTFVGGIVARTIATSNTFNFTAAVPSSLLNGSAGYDASGWGECMRTPPDSTVPSSGC